MLHASRGCAWNDLSPIRFVASTKLKVQGALDTSIRSLAHGCRRISLRISIANRVDGLFSRFRLLVAVGEGILEAESNLSQLLALQGALDALKGVSLLDLLGGLSAFSLQIVRADWSAFSVLAVSVRRKIRGCDAAAAS